MDIKLSKRMQAVADMVAERNVADIGCDHAFVSIYLANKPNTESVIAMDVRKGPVDIARANVAMHNLENKIQVRMSDGFEKLQVGEAQAAVIAGMGGYLMINILEAGKRHLQAGISLVLQPQSDIKAVREYLVQNGYGIDKEEMLIDEGKYYTVMRAVPVKEMTEYSQEEYSFGPLLLSQKHPVLKSYLEKLRDKDEQLIDILDRSETDNSRERSRELFEDKQYIERILDTYFKEGV